MFKTSKANYPEKGHPCVKHLWLGKVPRFLFQGTVIRVFSVPDGQKLYEFRRGMKRSVLSVCPLLKPFLAAI